MHVLVLQLAPMMFVALVARPDRIVVSGKLLQGLLCSALFLLVAAAGVPQVGRVTVPMSFAIGSIAMVVFLRRLTESRLIALLGGAGCALNVLPIVAYGAMPVSKAARKVIHSEALREPSVVAAKHVEIASGERLVWLGDTIPVPPLQAVISIGDVLLYATFALVGLSALAKRLAEAQQQTHGGVLFNQLGLRHS